MKVIFLDVDGVLNWVGSEARYFGFVGLDPERINQLNKIIDAHPDAKIVVSSTWRHAFMFDEGAYKDWPGLVKLFLDSGIKGDIIDKTPKKFSPLPRGGEIKLWLQDWRDNNPDEPLSFVILDDDTSGMRGDPNSRWEFDELRGHHVVTSWKGEMLSDGLGFDEGGLRDKHVQQAIDILNGKLLEFRS